jgi:hypothetical protein
MILIINIFIKKKEINEQEGKLNWKHTCFCKQKNTLIKKIKIHLIKYFYILEFKANIYFHYNKTK